MRLRFSVPPGESSMADTEAMLGECLERLTRAETESWQILRVGHMTIGRVIGRSLALEIELDPSQGAFRGCPAHFGRQRSRGLLRGLGGTDSPTTRF